MSRKYHADLWQVLFSWCTHSIDTYLFHFFIAYYQIELKRILNILCLMRITKQSAAFFCLSFSSCNYWKCLEAFHSNKDLDWIKYGFMAIISSHLLYRFANFKQWRRAAKLCRHGIHVSIIKLSTPLIFLFISSETINTLNWQKTLKKNKVNVRNAYQSGFVSVTGIETTD